MGATIAFSGKGGSGKTTLAAMLLRELVRTGRRPVLAVDADPNATLGLTLGARAPGTIADLRERLGQAAQDPASAPKQRLLEQWLGEILGENEGFDLLAMGRPEGPQCYCHVNALLRRYLSLLRGSYPVVVVDCEAGMEYLSRLTVDDVDALVLVAEPTPVGLQTAGRIAALADALPVRVGRRILAVNKLPRGAPVPQAPRPGADALLAVPFDEDLARRCAAGEPVDAEAGAAARAAVAELARRALGPAPACVAARRKETP